MSAWWWVLVGIAAFLLFSLVVGLALAAILGRIGEEVSELLEGESWVSAPLSREQRQEEEESPADERKPPIERISAHKDTA